MMPGFHLTGRHVAAIFVAFFAVVIAVNVLMASYAVSGFGGTVVDNSYVASQRFNGWLAQARQQDALGWQQETRLDGARHVILKLVGPRSQPMTVTATAEHPLGRAPDLDLRIERQADGEWRAAQPLPAGRWIIHWTARADGHEMRFVERHG